jgi:predicted nuclease with TOPRIM domain
VPEKIQDLQDSTTKLVEANNDPKADRKDKLRALKHVRIALESIARNIGWKHKAGFQNLKNRIERVENQDSLDANTLDDIWAEAEALARKAREVVRDSKFARGSSPQLKN